MPDDDYYDEELDMDSGGRSSSIGEAQPSSSQPAMYSIPTTLHERALAAFRKHDVEGRDRVDYEGTMSALAELGLLNGLTLKQLVDVLDLKPESGMRTCMYSPQQFVDFCGQLEQYHAGAARNRPPPPLPSGVPKKKPGASPGPERDEALRRLFANYCKYTAGQGRLAYDEREPRMALNQFTKLAQDLGLLQPTGTMTPVTIDLIFHRCKPVGGRRFGYQQFLTGMGALADECGSGVWEAATQLGAQLKQSKGSGFVAPAPAAAFRSDAQRPSVSDVAYLSDPEGGPAHNRLPRLAASLAAQGGDPIKSLPVISRQRYQEGDAGMRRSAGNLVYSNTNAAAARDRDREPRSSNPQLMPLPKPAFGPPGSSAGLINDPLLNAQSHHPQQPSRQPAPPAQQPGYLSSAASDISTIALSTVDNRQRPAQGITALPHGQALIIAGAAGQAALQEVMQRLEVLEKVVQQQRGEIEQLQGQGHGSGGGSASNNAAVQAAATAAASTATAAAHTAEAASSAASAAQHSAASATRAAEDAADAAAEARAAAATASETASRSLAVSEEIGARMSDCTEAGQNTQQEVEELRARVEALEASRAAAPPAPEPPSASADLLRRERLAALKGSGAMSMGAGAGAGAGAALESLVPRVEALEAAAHETSNAADELSERVASDAARVEAQMKRLQQSVDALTKQVRMKDGDAAASTPRKLAPQPPGSPRTSDLRAVGDDVLARSSLGDVASPRSRSMSTRAAAPAAGLEDVALLQEAVAGLKEVLEQLRADFNAQRSSSGDGADTTAERRSTDGGDAGKLSALLEPLCERLDALEHQQREQQSQQAQASARGGRAGATDAGDEERAAAAVAADLAGLRHEVEELRGQQELMEVQAKANSGASLEVGGEMAKLRDLVDGLRQQQQQQDSALQERLQQQDSALQQRLQQQEELVVALAESQAALEAQAALAPATAPEAGATGAAAEAPRPSSALAAAAAAAGERQQQQLRQLQEAVDEIKGTLALLQLQVESAAHAGSAAAEQRSTSGTDAAAAAAAATSTAALEQQLSALREGLQLLGAQVEQQDQRIDVMHARSAAASTTGITAAPSPPPLVDPATAAASATAAFEPQLAALREGMQLVAEQLELHEQKLSELAAATATAAATAKPADDSTAAAAAAAAPAAALPEGAQAIIDLISSSGGPEQLAQDIKTAAAVAPDCATFAKAVAAAGGLAALTQSLQAAAGLQARLLDLISQAGGPQQLAASLKAAAVLGPDGANVPELVAAAGGAARLAADIRAAAAAAPDCKAIVQALGAAGGAAAAADAIRALPGASAAAGEAAEDARQAAAEARAAAAADVFPARSGDSAPPAPGTPLRSGDGSSPAAGQSQGGTPTSAAAGGAPASFQPALDDLEQRMTAQLGQALKELLSQAQDVEALKAQLTKLLKELLDQTQDLLDVKAHVDNLLSKAGDTGAADKRPSDATAAAAAAAAAAAPAASGGPLMAAEVDKLRKHQHKQDAEIVELRQLAEGLLHDLEDAAMDVGRMTLSIRQLATGQDALAADIDALKRRRTDQQGSSDGAAGAAGGSRNGSRGGSAFSEQQARDLVASLDREMQRLEERTKAVEKMAGDKVELMQMALVKMARQVDRLQNAIAEQGQRVEPADAHTSVGHMLAGKSPVGAAQSAGSGSAESTAAAALGSNMDRVAVASALNTLHQRRASAAMYGPK